MSIRNKPDIQSLEKSFRTPNLGWASRDQTVKLDKTNGSVSAVSGLQRTNVDFLLETSIKKEIIWGKSNSIMNRALALYMTNLGSTPSTINGPLNPTKSDL